VMARVEEPAGCWRFALSTSSISAFPGACERATLRARVVGNPYHGADGVMLEHRKNA
jgi:hypothetical protein